MGARGIDVRVTSLLLSLAVGCGGVSTRNRGEEESSAGTSGSGASGAGGSSPTSGGATSGGGESTQAGQSSGGTPSWLAELSLSDTFPWFQQRHGGSFGMTPAAQEGVLHVVFEGSPVEWTVSTHNHLSVSGLVSGINFNVKSNAPRVIGVSVLSSLGADYFAARDAGKSWPVAWVEVPVVWHNARVSLDAMMPPEENPGADGPAFTIAFIVNEATGPVELWLNDVHFY